MKQVTVILFLLVLVKVVTSQASSEKASARKNEKLRICVPKDQMLDEVKNGCIILGLEKSGAECINGNDRLDCLRLINNDTADFGVFNPEELVSQATEEFTIVAELRTNNRAFQRYVVAVVDKSVLSHQNKPGKLHAVLRDRALCHPGGDVGEISGYSRTLNGYLEFLLQHSSECSNDERKIRTLAEYFGRSCRAGPWVADRDLDTELKRQYSSLCAACGSGTCSAKDRYWGALGALACVVEVGEVAWAEMTDVKSFFSDTFLKLLSTQKGQQLNPSKYALLCPDYTSQAIANTTDSCVWLHQPWPAVVTRSTRFLAVDKLIKLLINPEEDEGFWHSALTTVLGVTSSTLTPLEYPVSALDYLSKARGFRDAYSMQTCKDEGVRKIFKCFNGQEILHYKICNGVKDCADGSDETFRTCHNNTCPANSFRCAYGGCVDEGAACNGKKECHDGSDESDALCQVSANSTETTQTEKSQCILPPYPANGVYVVNGYPDAKPGQAFDSADYSVVCNSGYAMFDNNKKRICFDGVWSEPPSPCVPYCRLKKDPSLEFVCPQKGGGSRICNAIEPAGTEVRPQCNPDYKRGELRNMKCINGSWDYVASCITECGVIPSDPYGEKPVTQVPWHAVIYAEHEGSYEQICGGSLISPTYVITAARCFFIEGYGGDLSSYMVGLGKVDRSWIGVDEEGVQMSRVSDIRVTPKFQGFTDDIALVILAKEVQYGPNITPVCVDFSAYENRLAAEGTLGVIARWKEVEPDKERLTVLQMAFVLIEECLKYCQEHYSAFFQADKICANANGPILSDKDNGSGLSFPERRRFAGTTRMGKIRYYLRGVATKLDGKGRNCNLGLLSVFTQVARQKHFIEEIINKLSTPTSKFDGDNRLPGSSFKFDGDTRLPALPSTFDSQLPGLPSTFNSRLPGTRSSFNIQLPVPPSTFDTRLPVPPSTFDTRLPGPPSTFDSRLPSLSPELCSEVRQVANNFGTGFTKTVSQICSQDTGNYYYSEQSHSVSSTFNT